MTTVARTFVGSIAFVLVVACAAAPQTGPKDSHDSGSTPVLAWHREGGFAGFCDELKVTAAGEAIATSCKPGKAGDKQTRTLSADELRRLEQLRQDLGAVTVTSTDQATADGMKQTLTIVGRGSRQPLENERGELLNWAQGIYAKTNITSK